MCQPQKKPQQPLLCHSSHAIQFTHLVYNSGVFLVYSPSCAPITRLLELFHHPLPLESSSLISSRVPSPHPPRFLLSTHPLSVSMDLPLLDNKRNHTTCGLWCLTSFTFLNAFSVFIYISTSFLFGDKYYSIVETYHILLISWWTFKLFPPFIS